MFTGHNEGRTPTKCLFSGFQSDRQPEVVTITTDPVSNDFLSSLSKLWPTKTRRKETPTWLIPFYKGPTSPKEVRLSPDKNVYVCQYWSNTNNHTFISILVHGSPDFLQLYVKTRTGVNSNFGTVWRDPPVNLTLFSLGSFLRTLCSRKGQVDVRTSTLFQSLHLRSFHSPFGPTLLDTSSSHPVLKVAPPRRQTSPVPTPMYFVY